MKARILAAILPLVLACGASEPTARQEEVAAAPPASAEPAPAEPTIEFERVRTARLRAVIAASGTIEARRMTEVATEVPGRIVEVLVDVGDTVRKDEPLFRIDPGPYEMALAEAEAGLALARAESENAEQEAARLRTLLEQNAASQQRYDQLRTRAAVARAQVAQGKARVARARRDLARTEVRAPYDASVVERRAHEGAMAGPSPILVLQEAGAFEAILNVPEATPVAVRTGDPVRLFVDGVADPIRAKVERVSNRVDPGTRTYEVRGSVTDPSGLLKAGSYARAELLSSRLEERPVVHRSSLVARDGRNYVLLVENGVVRHVPVRVGVIDGERVEVLSGAEAGDLVVRGEAATRLADGARVEVGDRGEGASASTTHLETAS
ncbi:MAG: efflux RND transporter periplasmic adaptor subunit [Myxococcota bacterium]